MKPIIKSLLIAWLLAALLSLTGCKVMTDVGAGDSIGSESIARYSLSGHVVNTKGANVYVRDQKWNKLVANGITDAAGAFIISDLPAGRYEVYADFDGSAFTPFSHTIEIDNMDIIDIIFTDILEPELSEPNSPEVDQEPSILRPLNEIVLPNGKRMDDYMKERGIVLSGLDKYGVGDKFDQSDGSINLLSDSVGPQQTKNDLIALMVLHARDFACGHHTSAPRCTKWDVEADGSDPILRPVQSGLVYAYNGKNPYVRTRPADSCNQEIYGLDCSGLIYSIANEVGITVPRGTTVNQGEPDNWKIPEEWQLKMKVVTGELETGDIIFWPGHVGIYVGDGEAISSTGRSNDCIANLQKGPRVHPASQPGWFGSPTKVLRLVTALSGDYNMFVRCQGQQTDVAVIKFTIDNTNGGPFSADGYGIDYNGDQLCFSLYGNYDQAQNILKSTLALCDDSRSDAFSEKLLHDDIGYFKLNKIIDNNACLAEARLLRVGANAALAVGVSESLNSSSSSVFYAR